jgi:hypothetical protein
MFKQELNDTNYMEFITKNFPKISEELNTYEKNDQYNTKLIVALLTIIQGGATYSDRYYSLNMLNLVPGGIGTVEFRIKQGSNDVEENRMYMLLLAEFIQSIINLSEKSDKIMISSALHEKQLAEDFWNLHNMLIKNNWTLATKLAFDNTPIPPVTSTKKMTSGLSLFRNTQKQEKSQNLQNPPKKTDKEIITSLFKYFFTHIKNKEVKNYWQTVADNLYKTGLVTPSQVKGGRDAPASIHNLLQSSSKPKSTSKSKLNKPVSQKVPSNESYLYNSHLKHPPFQSMQKQIYNSSFGTIDYNKINNTMNANGYKEFYAAYKKDMNIKAKSI